MYVHPPHVFKPTPITNTHAFPKHPRHRLPKTPRGARHHLGRSGSPSRNATLARGLGPTPISPGAPTSPDPRHPQRSRRRARASQTRTPSPILVVAPAPQTMTPSSLLCLGSPLHPLIDHEWHDGKKKVSTSHLSLRFNSPHTHPPPVVQGVEPKRKVRGTHFLLAREFIALATQIIKLGRESS